MTDLSLEQLDQARRDPEVFARVLIGQALWEHQAEVVRSRARYRLINAGRRSGKTHVFGVLGLHQGFSVPRSKTVIVSAGEKSAKRMLKDIAEMLRSSPLLAGSVVDESTSQVTLSNGSTIECVAASMGAVRAAEADLLIVDEAGFVDQQIWEAAEPLVVARPGSRVLLCSTPWGDAEHFFRSMWHRAMEHPSDKVEAWHWPSSISPLVDQELLADIEESRGREYFEREYLALWGDASGSYLASDDITACIDSRALLVPAQCGGSVHAIGGIDWGQARDASTLVALTVDEQATWARADRRPVYRVAFLLERFRTPYHEFIDEVLETGRGLALDVLASEVNGVGAMPTSELRRQLMRLGRSTRVAPVTTSSTTKADSFGLVRLLLQQRRLLLPDHPALLKQLRSLQYEQLPAGGVRISVPEALGHDDLAMGLALAMSLLVDGVKAEEYRWDGPRLVQTRVRVDARSNGPDVDRARAMALRLAELGDRTAMSVLRTSALSGARR